MATTELLTKNGQYYKLTKDGKVKKVSSLQDLPTIIDASKTEEMAFMQTLFKFLKTKDDNVVNKKGKLVIRDFELGFSTNGFQIRDRKNFNKVREDFDNLCPTPREVWEFISTPKIIKPLAKIEEELDVKLEATLKKIRKLKTLQPKHEEPLLPEPPKEVDLEVLRKKAINMIQRNKKPAKIIEKLEGLIPNRSYNVFLGKLIRSFTDGKMRGAKFRLEVLQLTRTVSFKERPKPAPKFTGIPFYSCNELTINDNMVTIVSDNIGKMTVSVSEFLCRYVLHTEPKCMASLFKVIRGTQTPEQFLNEPFIRDRFEDFTIKLLKDTNLADVCEQFLSDYGIPNPLLYVYRHESDLKVGEEIKVYWIGSHEWMKGKVISTKTGIEVRYADGEVTHLHKGQLWKRIAEKTK